MTCRVGLLDSGVDAIAGLPVTSGQRFAMPDTGDIVAQEAGPDDSGHGTAMARIIAATPDVEILSAQVFAGSAPTSAAVLAAGLDWLVGQGAHIINMSFGLARDRDVLRDACQRATSAGVIMLAAAPARGASVFPSSYPGVIRVTGDARCQRGEFSTLNSTQADFGAHPAGLASDPAATVASGGASFAVAHVTGEIARWWPSAKDRSAAAAVVHLAEISIYHGPEMRS